MKGKTTFNFEDFKEKIKNDGSFRSKITDRSDVINMDAGTMLIYRENLSKYLEKYMCKDESDLENTLWYNYGVYVKVLD